MAQNVNSYLLNIAMATLVRQGIPRPKMSSRSTPRSVTTDISRFPLQSQAQKVLSKIRAKFLLHSVSNLFDVEANVNENQFRKE